MSDNIIVFTPQNIWDKIFDLAQNIKQAEFCPDIIIGILRGGLEVTRTLSDLLEIKQVSTIGVGFYKGINETLKKPQLTQELIYDVKNKHVLLVDDVADTGKSMAFALKYMETKKASTIRTATIHHKPHSIFKPNFFVEETSNWIVYPWEYVEFSKLFINKQRTNKKTYYQIAIELKKLGIPKKVVDNILPEK